MRYIFKALILGDPQVIEFYMLRAFGEPGEDHGTYFEWYKEIKVLEDVCDLEIDVVTSDQADFDALLTMVDGIIYFLNPLIKEESELFEMILPDIFSVKRDIPTILIFYDQNGILPISINELLENVWVNYPSLEAFVNLPPKDFHQALQSLSLAMINGDTPLNIENAWMRFPIFIQMANIYFSNKNYYYAAQAVKKASLIAEIYNKEEFFIFCEQAAFLYSKMNLYLEASKILEKVDKTKSINYKNLYADAMIREGNLYFNRKEFEKAASQYERTAQWSSIESLDTALIYDAFKLAINSWISACKVENAFKILDNLPHKLVLSILMEISEKIQEAADYLIETNNFEQAREQLYNAVNKYQREGLFEDLKDLTAQLTKILIHIFKQFVSDGNILAAKNIYDELENMLEAYKVEKSDLDSTLEKLISGFLDENDFETASVLINKLNSRILRQNLTKIRDEFEDRHSVLVREEHAAYINKGIEILREFFEAEIDIIIKMNTKIIKEAEELSKQGDFLRASIQLKNQAKYLKNIGKFEIKDQIFTKSLDTSLEGTVFKEFFTTFNELSDDMKKKYLTRVFLKFIQKLRELKEIDDYKEKELILEKSNRIFRSQMLYEESKEISLIYIDIIKEEALRILENEGNRSGITEAEELIKKALNISESYLEKKERSNITYDKIFKKIAEIFIYLGDLPSANAFNDKIEDKKYKSDIHKEIEKLESREIATASKRAEDLYKEEILKEQASIIKKKGSEALLEREIELRKRKALKRVHFKDALEKIKLKEYGESFELYKKSIIKLNNVQKYNLAGVSLAIASFLLILKEEFDEIKKLNAEIKNSLSSLGRLFSETYPVTLINYIIDLKKFHDEEKIKEALGDFENLPLFEEELVLLYDYLGKDYREELDVKKEAELKLNKKMIKEDDDSQGLSRKELGDLSKLKIDMDQRYGKIKSLMVEIRSDRDKILKNRNAMRKRYYSDILKLLGSQNYRDASVKYYELAKTIAKRKDLVISSLLVLLHGLVLIKLGEPIKSIKKNINEFLDGLGINKKFVKETYYLMVILFIIDVKLYNLDKYRLKTKKILEILPLLEEEKELIDLEL